MASRYSSTKVFDYCFNPIHIVDDSKDVVVPCGKCDGCLLHRANEWSQRLAHEIENAPFAVFTTLTYNNKYLPKLVSRSCQYQNEFDWYSDHSLNIRATLVSNSDSSFSVVDKLREDGISIERSYLPVKVTNFNDYPCIPYASKRDVQLYLKLIRKLIYERFPQKTIDSKRIRYHIISEYGETLYRPHFHAIFIFFDEEVASYFTQYLVYTCWPMCDKDRIADYTQYCDSRASSYLTQYVNSISRLPKVYREVKCLRPFRLASKAFAIGYNNFDKNEVSEEIIKGNFEYRKSVASLGQSIMLRFPKGYLSSVFPKSYEFGKSDDRRKYRVYSLFYVYMQDSSFCRQCRECHFTSRYDCVSLRLRESLRPQDYIATKKCYDYCLEFGCVPQHYLYVLDLVYYKQAMNSLKLFYEYQQCLADRQEWLSIGRLYNNFADLRNKILNGTDYDIFVTRLFLDSIHCDVADIDTYDNYAIQRSSLDFDSYKLEVEDILSDMVKLPKFNEMVGTSPNNV